MVKALGLMYCRLFPLKQDCPFTINGRTLRFVKAPLPTTPHGSPPMLWLDFGHVGCCVTGSGTRAVRQTLSRAPVMVRALPVAMLTTVLVSHPPANAFRNPFRPSRPGRL